MPNVVIAPQGGPSQHNRPWEVVGLTYATADADIGKPVKLSTTANCVELCDDGDAIYGFIDSIEVSTSNGRVVASILEKGCCHVTASTLVAIDTIVEAGANAAAGTKPTSWGVVSTHTPAAGEKTWRALTSAADGEDFVIATD